MPLPIADYLVHILDEIGYLKRKSTGVTKQDFLHDETLQRAFVRSIEIIGEAAKQIPEDLRLKYPEAEWHLASRMRDRLIHGYFTVDYEIVWNVIIAKL